MTNNFSRFSTIFLKSLKGLIVDLGKAAASILLELVRIVIDEWPDRLKKCVKTKGGHFEY